MGFWVWRRITVALVVALVVLLVTHAAPGLIGTVALLAAGTGLRARTLRLDWVDAQDREQ